MSASGQYMYASSIDGTYRSSNYGNNWVAISGYDYRAMSCSANGQVWAGAVNGSPYFLHVSNDAGITIDYNQIGAGSWRSVNVCRNGNYIFACQTALSQNIFRLQWIPKVV